MAVSDSRAAARSSSQPERAAALTIAYSPETLYAASGTWNASRAARITSIPTLMAFRDGILVFSQPGALPAAALEQVIQGVRDLDMDEIRSRLARQDNKGVGKPENPGENILHCSILKG